MMTHYAFSCQFDTVIVFNMMIGEGVIIRKWKVSCHNRR